MYFSRKDWYRLPEHPRWCWRPERISLVVARVRSWYPFLQKAKSSAVQKKTIRRSLLFCMPDKDNDGFEYGERRSRVEQNYPARPALQQSVVLLKTLIPRIENKHFEGLTYVASADSPGGREYSGVEVVRLEGFLCFCFSCSPCMLFTCLTAWFPRCRGRRLLTFTGDAEGEMPMPRRALLFGRHIFIPDSVHVQREGCGYHRRSRQNAATSFLSVALLLVLIASAVDPVASRVEVPQETSIPLGLERLSTEEVLPSHSSPALEHVASSLTGDRVTGGARGGVEETLAENSLKLAKISSRNSRVSAVRRQISRIFEFSKNITRISWLTNIAIFAGAVAVFFRRVPAAQKAEETEPAQPSRKLPVALTVAVLTVMAIIGLYFLVGKPVEDEVPLDGSVESVPDNTHAPKVADARVDSALTSGGVVVAFLAIRRSGPKALPDVLPLLNPPRRRPRHSPDGAFEQDREQLSDQARKQAGERSDSDVTQGDVAEADEVDALADKQLALIQELLEEALLEEALEEALVRTATETVNKALAEALAEFLQSEEEMAAAKLSDQNSEQMAGKGQGADEKVQMLERHPVKEAEKQEGAVMLEGPQIDRTAGSDPERGAQENVNAKAVVKLDDQRQQGEEPTRGA